MPTHSGRCGTLDELLQRLGQEPGIEDVEVCVSDNASSDSTPEVIQRHRRRFGGQLRYLRHERDIGMAGNVLSVVEMATGDFCWLMGSDDAPAPGALERIRELIAGHPGIGGLVVGHLRVEAENLDRPGSVVVPEPYPHPRTVTRLRGYREVIGHLGYVMYFTSDQVVDRRLWRAVVTDEEEQVRKARSGPHLYVTGRMVRRRPDWLWCPELLVLSREAPVYLSSTDGLGFAATIRRMIGDLDWIMARLHGRRSYEYRASMHKVLRHVWDLETLVGVRLHSPGPRDYVANLLCARRFWWSRWFWRRAMPRLVLPARPVRCGANRAIGWGATTRLSPAEPQAGLSGEVPGAMSVGYSTRVRVRVENRGRQPLSSATPLPVHLWARWEEAETGRQAQTLTGGTALWPPLRPSGRRTVELLLAPPPRPGRYRVYVALHQAEVGWFERFPDGVLEAAVDVRAVEPG